MPTIIRVLPDQIGEMVVVQVLREDSIAGAFLDFPAVLQRAESLRLRVCGAFRNDVDDAVHGVGAPYSSARSANHLNALKVLQRHVLGVPVNAAEEWRINSPAIDQDKQFVGEL